MLVDGGIWRVDGTLTNNYSGAVRYFLSRFLFRRIISVLLMMILWIQQGLDNRFRTIRH